MADIAVKRASLWRESWRAINDSASTFWPSVAGFGLALSVFYFLIYATSHSELARQVQQNPLFFKQHPELASSYIHGLLRQLLWFVPLLGAMSVGYYGFTVMYLRLAMKNNRPDYSVNGYFYWLGKALRKWLRALWLLLPIIGVYFYFRAILRYQLVSPLAVLHRGDELKTSWNLTRGNWWRIFWNYVVLMLLVIAIPLACFLVLGVIAGVVLALAQHTQPFWVHLIGSLVQGFMGGIAIASFSIFSCIVYRILSQEARQAVMLPPASNSIPS